LSAIKIQHFYSEKLEREMGCTEADWLRWLLAAVGDQFMKRFSLYLQRGGGCAISKKSA
jgi:hypothetical protein